MTQQVKNGSTPTNGGMPRGAFIAPDSPAHLLPLDQDPACATIISNQIACRTSNNTFSADTSALALPT